MQTRGAETTRLAWELLLTSSFCDALITAKRTTARSTGTQVVNMRSSETEAVGDSNIVLDG